MYKPDNIEPVTSKKQKKHDVKIEDNGQIIFNVQFHRSNLVGDSENTNTVFRLFPVNTDNQEKIIISFADESQLSDDNDYLNSIDDREGNGFFILKGSDLKKGLSVPLKNCFHHAVPNKGYRYSFIEGESLEVDLDHNFITLDISNVTKLEKKSTQLAKIETKGKRRQTTLIHSWLDLYLRNPDDFMDHMAGKMKMYAKSGKTHPWDNRDSQRMFWDKLESLGDEGKRPNWYMQEIMDKKYKPLDEE